jgi:hypothetical protein
VEEIDAADELASPQHRHDPVAEPALRPATLRGLAEALGLRHSLRLKRDQQVTAGGLLDRYRLVVDECGPRARSRAPPRRWACLRAQKWQPTQRSCCLAVEQTAQDRSALLNVLTTEHFTLQGARSATITESLGRSTIYLGSLSASLVALALIAQGESAGDDFRLFALLILPAILFLGTVTFVRIVETGIEDAIYAQAINRIRHYYLELAREDARYFSLGANDDMEGVLANMGMTASRWRPFFSVASVIALINSMVAGALTGVILDAFARRPTALIAGVAVTLIALPLHYRLGYRRFLRALERFTPIFPSGAARPGLP